MISVGSVVRIYPGPPVPGRCSAAALEWTYLCVRNSVALRRRAAGSGALRSDEVGGISSAGRAPGLQPGGHRFDPGILHQRFPDRGFAAGRTNSLTTEYSAIGSSLTTHTQCCGNENLVKLLRAYGECLGANSRRRTWQAAISLGEPQAGFDPGMSEWGNPLWVIPEYPHLNT